MKKYTKANFKMIFTSIILPVILFFTTISSCYFIFSAQIRNNNNKDVTPLLQLSFSNQHTVSINSQIISSNQTILPGDKMEIKGKLENTGASNAYCILVLAVNITKQNSNTSDFSYSKAFSLSDGQFSEITENNGNYSIHAFSLECANETKTNEYSVSFSLPFIFDGQTFDSSYENSKITYVISAHAVIQDDVEGIQTATEILMNNVQF